MNTAHPASDLRGELLRDEPMARHTSWRVGGPAELLYRPADVEDLGRFLASLASDVAVLWVGLGSNLLVRDAGIAGAVVLTHRVLSDIERVDDTLVRVEAGVACAKLARRCVRWGLGPAAFFAGIPGTVGGALAMNAGAFGGETWTCVHDVQVMARDGRQRRRGREEYQIGYRSVTLPAEEWFLSACMRFTSDADADGAAIRELLAKRKETQPIGEPSCGSVFRNPDGDHAARLIEAAGLKGFAIGGAQVSPMHANFIINTGHASAADIETLIEHVGDRVEEEHGVRLKPEVRIVGEHGG